MPDEVNGPWFQQLNKTQYIISLHLTHLIWQPGGNNFDVTPFYPAGIIHIDGKCDTMHITYDIPFQVQISCIISVSVQCQLSKSELWYQYILDTIVHYITQAIDTTDTYQVKQAVTLPEVSFKASNLERVACRHLVFCILLQVVNVSATFLYQLHEHTSTSSQSLGLYFGCVLYRCWLSWFEYQCQIATGNM